MKAIRMDYQYKSLLGDKFDYDGLDIMSDEEDNGGNPISIFNDEFARRTDGLIARDVSHVSNVSNIKDGRLENEGD